MKENATIIALSGKGGVGKTSISAAIVKLLVQNFPDKKILAIDADPALVNKDPYGEGWMVKIKMSAPEEVDSLLSADDYAAFIDK